MLTSSQRIRIEQEAAARGVDPDELIAEAEAVLAERDKPAPTGGSAKPGKTDVPLYMYHLPFVTVNEVRTRWLGLDPVAGGEQYAAEWAAERSAAVKADEPIPPAPAE